MKTETNTKSAIVDAQHKVDYSTQQVPPTYKCGKCGAHGCKLWRDYQTFLENQSLLCAKCTAEEQKENISDINADGIRTLVEIGGSTDTIGWRVPAVPTEENDTFWGYCAVPPTGCEWWRRLPTLPEQRQAS